VVDVRAEDEVKLTDFTKWLRRPGRLPRDVTQRQRIRSILRTEVSRQDCCSEPTEALGRPVLRNDRQAETGLIPRNLAFTLRTSSGPMSLRRDQAFPHASHVDQVVFLA
jgi:hypothetical protein